MEGDGIATSGTYRAVSEGVFQTLAGNLRELATVDDYKYRIVA
jgi:hypothetical protein